MNETVLDKMPALLARFNRSLRARYRKALSPYLDLPATPEAVRGLWSERAKSVPARIMLTEKVALRLLLGKRFHAAMPRKEK